MINATWHSRYLRFLVWLTLVFLLWLFLKINWGEFRYLGYLSVPVALCLSFLAYGQANLVFKYRLFLKNKSSTSTKISQFLRSLGLVVFFALTSLIFTSLLISLLAWSIFQIPDMRTDVMLKRDIYLGLDLSATSIFWWLLGVLLLYDCAFITKAHSNFAKPNMYVMAIGAGFSLLSFFAYFWPKISSSVSL